jgi:hypothetical protein
MTYDESKYISDHPPMLIYLPSENIFRKFLKAIFECKNVEEMLSNFV